MKAEDDGGVISANGRAEDSRVRIYVGGLGGSVSELDLRKTFSSNQMGLVQSVEVVRTKGRSFAYLDFVPFSDKGLSTLFSKYNGCTWKGGKLKLEKAKEHYSARLRREWAEDTAICKNSKVHSDNNVEPSTPKKLTKTDMENMYLQLFFPRLKKTKEIPFKGTGKHKYSFQHIVVPAFPRHFCDCEEHSSSPSKDSKLVCQNASSTYADGKEGVVGMNKEELDTMNSVLSKILAREQHKADVGMVESSNLANDLHARADKESDDGGELVMNLVAAAENDLPVSDTEEDRGSDEDDNIIINIVAGGNAKKSFSDITSKYTNTTAANKGLKGSKHNGPDNNVPTSNIKKRKAHSLENGDGNSLPHPPPHAKLQLEDQRPTKNPWRNLKSGNATFHISDIAAQNNTHGADVHGKPDKMKMKNKKAKSSEEKEEKQKGDRGNPEVAVAAENKSVKRNSWMQKSSWMQLVGDPSNSTFSISQVLSGSSGGLNMENQDQEQLLQTKNEHQISEKGDNSNLQQGDMNVSVVHAQSIINNDSVMVSLQEGNNNDIDTKDASPTTALADKKNEPKLQKVDPYSFVRSAASLKEWKKAKKALNRAGRRST